MEHTFFFDASHTINPRFLCSEILWFAEHNFLGVLGSRLIKVSFHHMEHDAAVSPRKLPGRFKQQNTWGT
jgi:hypothetical protein